MNKISQIQSGFYAANLCQLDDMKALITQTTSKADVPNATDIIKNIPIYDMAITEADLGDLSGRKAIILAEWANILLNGAGVFVIKQAQPDHTAIDTATKVYDDIIAEEKAAGDDSADHFATAGANDRIWNSLQKLCLKDPGTFVRYFASPAIDAACEAWLGPNYQMTAQINLVHPGGKAQQAHRDYHLGFQTAEISATYPAHVHELSPLMTLQGGLAHCDIPIESGPTKLLPFSQLYKPGYAAWRRDDFRELFEAHYVQVALDKGDAIFFNPALFHAAGENTSKDIHRMVNLFQISSAFGRAMETINRDAMCLAVYKPLYKSWTNGSISETHLDAVIASTAEGYSFPTNLDNDPPVEGLAPITQAALLKECILQGQSFEIFQSALVAQANRKKP